MCADISHYALKTNTFNFYRKKSLNKTKKLMNFFFFVGFWNKGPGILKGCVNEASICAPFAHSLSEMCIKSTQAPPNNGSGYGMTKNYQTFICMA